MDSLTSTAETNENAFLLRLFHCYFTFKVCIYVQYFFHVVKIKLQKENIY